MSSERSRRNLKGWPSSLSFSWGAFLCIIAASYFLLTAGYALTDVTSFGGTIPHFLRYIAVPLAIAGGLLWGAFRTKAETRLMVGVNAVAILAALFAHEAVANAGFAKSVALAVETAEAKIAKGLDENTSLPPGVTIRRLNKEFGAKSLDDAVLGGLPRREVTMCFDPAQGPVTYRADRFGFNNPDDVYDRAVEIAVFGDSFVEGFCLQPGADVAGRLRADGHNAASFGMRGNGPLIELAGLGRFGGALEPRTSVVMYYAGNDWTNLEREAATPWIVGALKEDADFGPAEWSDRHLRSADSVIEELWRSSGMAASKKYRRRAIRNYVALAQTWSVLGLHYPSAPKRQPIFDDVLARMKNLTASWNGELILVYIPRAERFRGVLPNDFVYDADRRIVAKAAREAGLPFIDLASAFSDDNDPLANFGPDGHFSEEGSDLAARLIVEKMRELADPAIALAPKVQQE